MRSNIKIFIDTNILISAALFPNSIPAQAFMKAVSYPYSAFICDVNVDELHKVFQRKFPKRIEYLNAFEAASITSVTVVKAPETPVSNEDAIRDPKDRPIFRAAITVGVDLFLTGDKDFLESGVKDPRIVTPSIFLHM